MKRSYEKLKAIGLLLTGLAIGLSVPRKDTTDNNPATETRQSNSRSSRTPNSPKTKDSAAVQINDHPKYLTKLNIGTKTGYSLLDGNSKLTSQAISLAKITEAESLAIQDRLDSFHSSMSELLSSNIVSDPLRTNEGAGIKAYRILPFPAEAETKLISLKKSITEIIGESRGNDLLATFSDPSRYSGFGSFETNIALRKAAGNPDGFFNDSELWRIDYDMKDADSGKSIFGGNESISSFFRKNGRIPILDSATSSN